MTSNVAAAKAIIDSQAAKGLGKYSVPLERSDATISRLARHGAEEMADALCYFVALEARAVALEAEVERLRPLLDLVSRIPGSITGDWPTEVRRALAAGDAAK